jgi:ribonuclease H2 subunit A
LFGKTLCKQVVRDRTLRKWEFKEPNLKLSTNFGSGYPSGKQREFVLKRKERQIVNKFFLLFVLFKKTDPYTKKWLQNSLDPVFGFPSVMRFSWKTSSEILSSGATDVKW